MAQSFTNAGLNVDGRQYSIQSLVTSDTVKRYEFPLAGVTQAQTKGELTTRTNDTDGVITFPAGHGLTTGTHNLLWTGGQRIGVNAVLAGDLATISGGSGDNLPALNTTDMRLYRVTDAKVNIVGDNVQLLAVVYQNASLPTAKAFFDMYQSAVSVWSGQVDTIPQGSAFDFVANVQGGMPNPIAGQVVDTIFASHEETQPGLLEVLVASNQIN